MALVLLYLGIEVLGGFLSGSLALLADAGHMLSDAAALGLTLFALKFARRPATTTRTYGYYRAEILAALANGATLVGLPSSFSWRQSAGSGIRQRWKADSCSQSRVAVWP